MTDTILSSYKQQYSETPIYFNAFSIKKTGIITNQSTLHIEDYVLTCVPYQLTMVGAQVLGILSAKEAAFFGKYTNSLCSIQLTYQASDQPDPINLFLRSTLSKVEKLPNKEHVCIFEVKFRNTPNDLIRLVGDYLATLDSLKKQFDQLKDKSIKMDKQAIKTIGYNNYFEAALPKGKIRAKVLLLSVQKLLLAFSPKFPVPQEGEDFSASIYFQSYQFTLNGKAQSVTQLQNGFYKVDYFIEFSPELVEIIDNFFFTLRFQNEKKE